LAIYAAINHLAWSNPIPSYRKREGERENRIVLTDYVLLLFVVDGEEIKEQNCSFEAVYMAYIE
jgi:hypothetical protein